MRLRLATPLCVLWLLAPACRDEQAGPRPRVPAPPPPAQARTLDSAPADLTHRSGATLAGGALTYLGTRVSPPRPAPGQRVTLAHYFQAQRPPPQGWAFFVHLLDAQTGQMLTNADHEFGGGALPLASWPVGKVVEDVHTLAAPATPARVVLGFWRDEARLAVDDPAAQDGLGRLLGPVLGEAPPLPQYRAPRAPRPPRVDGDLSDEAWKRAEPVPLKGSYDGRPVSLRTQARVLWDDAHLYFAFEVEDPDVWGTYRERDQPLYEQEVVEVFLDADGDGRTYNELQVSPHNVLFDAYFPERRQGMDLGWDSGARSAVRVRGTLDRPEDRDEGWSVELQVPLARLASVPRLPPRAGERWRFNLYRLEHPGRTRVEGQAFSPLYVGDFHALARFGWLVFEEGPP